MLTLSASPLVYVAMYLFAVLDGLLPPIPSESLVIALAAVSSAAGHPSLWLVTLVAAAGAFTGDQLTYLLGRRIDLRGSRLLRGERAQRALDRAGAMLDSRGAVVVVSARFVPAGRVAVNLTAGAFAYPRRRFVLLSALGTAAWAVYFTVIGIGAGAWLDGRPVLAIVVGVVGGITLGVVADRAIHRLRHLRAARRPAAAGSGAPTDPERDADPGLPTERAVRDGACI